MSTRSLTLFVLGCALGFGVAFVALRDGGSPIAPSDEQIGPRVTEILNGKDPLRRVEALSALLPTLGPSALPSLLEAFEGAPVDSGDPELVLLGMWWARFDPQAAFRWTSTEWRARYGLVIAAVFRSWAHGDPRLALATARGIGFPVQRDLAVDAAIAGWDESGQPGLVEALAQLDDVDQQRLAEGFARRRVVTLGPAGALRWLESLEESPRFREVMSQRIASAAAESKAGGPLAAEWATPLIRSDERLSHYPRRIATRWVGTDPKAAMAWLATLPAGADRRDGVIEAFRAWMIRDLKAASAWMEETELQPWNEPALAVYARSFASERPKEAIELAQRISDRELRETTMIVIGKEWTRLDRAAAEAWLAQPDVPERVRRVSAMAPGDNPAFERKRQARAEKAMKAMTDAVPE